MILLKKIAIVCTILIICAFPSEAKFEKLKVGMDYGYPPFEFLENDTVKGFLPDFIKLIGQEVQFEPMLFAGQWDIIRSDFVDGKYDIIGMFYSAERAEEFNLSISFLNVTHTVFRNIRADDITHGKQLSGIKILAEVSEVVRHNIIQAIPDVEIVIVDNPSVALSLLIAGDYDYAVLPKIYGLNYLKINNITNIVSTDYIVSQYRYCFAVSKENELLINRIKEGINLVKEKGKFDELYLKWFGELEETYDSKAFYKMIFYILIPIIIIVGSIIIWNLMLTKQVKRKTKEIEKELEEKRKTQTKLISSQFALDHAVDAIFSFNPDGKFIYANRSACEQLGYSESEFLAKQIFDIDLGLNIYVWEDYLKLIKEKGFLSLQSIHRKKDNTTIIVEGNIYYFKIEDTENIFAIYRDITYKDKTVKELKRSEELFRNMFEKSSVIMYLADPKDFRIVDVNNSAMKFYGYSKEEFIKLTIMDLNRLSFDEVKDLIDRENRQEIVSVEIKHYLSNGDEREVTVSGSSLMLSENDFIFTIVTDNTEKNQANKRLKDSEEKFSRAFMTSPDAVNINRLSDGLYIDVNESFLAILGYKRKEVIGKTSIELNIWENFEDRKKLVSQLKKKGEYIGLESKFVKKDGTILYGLMSARLIDLQGEKCIISMTRDITEKKKEELNRLALFRISEAAISSPDFDSLCKQIHSILSELLPATNLYIALYNKDTQVFEFPYFVDEYDQQPAPIKRRKGLTELVVDSGETWLVDPKEFYELARLGRVENIGTPSIDWLGAPLKINEQVIGAIVVQSYTEGVRYNEEHKNILSFVSNQIAMAISQKRAQEALLRANEMLEQRVQARTKELIEANDELQAQIDVRKRIEHEIRESEERFRLLADSAPVMIWLTNENGMLYYVNHSWLNFTGKDIDSTINNLWMDDIHDDDVKSFKQTYFNSTENMQSFQIKVRMKNYSGLYRYVLFNAVPRFQRTDEFIGFIGTGIDITEMHNALEQEKELNSMKTQFISTVSHEYRTPLTTILTSTYLIETFIKTGNASDAGKFLERIQESVKSMTSLLDQVLTISRSDSGKIFFNPQLLSINKLCSSLLDEVRIIDKEHHKFVMNSSLSNDEEVYLDPNLTQQILNNLITNAIKYSPDNSVITLSVIRDDYNCILSVSDEGMGIPEEQISQLFEPFFRASNVGVVQGTGLGMSIVKRSVELCNGEINVESTIGVGTTVIVKLPCNYSNEPIA